MKSFDKDYKTSYSSKDFSIHANHALESYGKSFHWARYFLGSKTAKNATLLYVFCRYLDDLADNKNTNNFDALNIIYKTILNPENSNSKNPYIRSFINLSKENNIPTFPAEDLLLGLINDQNKVRIKDETQLIRYSYQVAGTVGLMMAYILGVKNERRWKRVRVCASRVQSLSGTCCLLHSAWRSSTGTPVFSFPPPSF